MTTDINHQRDAWIITTKYNFMPETDIKFEVTSTDDDINNNLFANKSNRVKILIGYNSDDLDQEP